MTNSHTHVVVRDCPPPHSTEVVGRIYAIAPAFKTYVPDYAPNFEDDEDEVEEVETKVVRRGRRPKAKANELAETK